MPVPMPSAPSALRDIRNTPQRILEAKIMRALRKLPKKTAMVLTVGEANAMVRWHAAMVRRAVAVAVAVNPIPAAFQPAGRAIVAAELEALAGAAQRLVEAAGKMHPASIDALAALGITRPWIAEQAQRIIRATKAVDIEAVPENPGRGRSPGKPAAHMVAGILASIYAEKTGNRPTVTTTKKGRAHVPYGPFFDLVQEIFKAARIKASPEMASRKAARAFRAGSAATKGQWTAADQ